MAPHERFDSFLRRLNYPAPNTNLLLAVSGGPDSVALLLLAKNSLFLRKRRVCVFACHINHGLRPESDIEERIVTALCRRLSVPCTVKRLGGLDRSESAARTARISALASLATRLACSTVATAHTADDQAETAILRLLRASTAPIPTVSRLHGVTFIHPLLWAQKEELLQMLHSAGVGYVLDETNFLGDNLRSRIRREVMPSLKALRGGFVRSAAKALSDVATLSAPFEKRNFFGLEEVWVSAQDVYSARGYEVLVAAVAAFSAPPPDREHFAQILALPKTGGCVDIHSQLRCVFETDHFVIWRPTDAEPVQEKLKIPGKTTICGASIRTRILPEINLGRFLATKTPFAEVARLPKGEILVRRVRDDDRFVPFGRSKETSVLRFLKSAGIAERRRRFWLVLDSDEGIVWVVGVRLDERFRATEGKRCLLVEVECDV